MDPFHHVLFLDVETVSAADLSAVGAWTYSRHPSTRVYCMSFAFGRHRKEEPPVGIIPGDKMREVFDFVRGGGVVVAHNVSFERSIWENIMVPRHGYPPIDPQQWRCTQALGLALNLPATLEGLARALGCPVQKDLEGAALMRKMSKAVESTDVGSYHYPLATPTNLRRLVSYCEQDVATTRECYYAMAPLSLTEQRVWLADQQVNARGVYLDREFARRCLQLSEERKAQLDAQVFSITAGELSSASAPPAMKTWIKKQGVELPKVTRAKGTATETLDAQTMQRLLESPELPDPVRMVLKRRREAARITSLAKLQRVAEMADPRDGRLRHALQYAGAHTGRWTSYGLQLHNLPRVKLSTASLALARMIVERGDLDTLLLAFDRPMQILSQLLRSVITAPPGKELIGGDFSAIEARVIAWLAGQDDVLDLFAAKQDVYTHAAHAVGSNDRQLGKVCTLALGYGMGPVKFAATADAWNVKLEVTEAKRIAMLWRERNAAIVAFWAALETAAYDAVRHPGVRYTAGKVRCKATPCCLILTLPSGRSLRYWRPSLAQVPKRVPVVEDNGEIKTVEFTATELRFFQVGRDRTSMTVTSTYGGKLAENVTQAVARDLLGEALARLEGHPLYEPVIHVHDSLACEVPAGEGSVAEVQWLLEEVPPWAAGLPVAADCYRDTRFRG